MKPMRNPYSPWVLNLGIMPVKRKKSFYFGLCGLAPLALSIQTKYSFSCNSLSCFGCLETENNWDTKCSEYKFTLCLGGRF